MANPKVVLLFSGKRKSGKDHTVNRLIEHFNDECQVLRISEPIKAHFAKAKDLSLSELLGDGPYKEQYRLEMIQWGETKRRQDYGYFCRAAVETAKIAPLWIVSDVRRKTDLKWFRENFQLRVKTIRVVADDDVRRERGWKFTEGVDDAESECNLDDVDNWDCVLTNNAFDVYNQQLSEIISNIKKALDL